MIGVGGAGISGALPPSFAHPSLPSRKAAHRPAKPDQAAGLASPGRPGLAHPGRAGSAGPAGPVGLPGSSGTISDPKRGSLGTD